MAVKSFGRKGNGLATIRFAHLINYLNSEGLTFNKGNSARKIGKYKTLSAINWVEFDIQPTELSRVYKILIVYISGYTPYAYVVTPSLNKLNASEMSIPHLYCQNRFQLCLHYPHTNDYNENEEIGKQYIPWIKLWLYYFEEWLSSKNWCGGGVEPNDEFDLKHNPKHLKDNKDLKLTKEDMDTFYSAKDEANKIYDRRLKKLMQGIKKDSNEK
jgi:hypothetical protein